MSRIALIHWNAEEGRERAAILRAAGHGVAFDVPRDFTFLRRLRADPPDAVVIDLSRLPSQGRDLALALRYSKATRGVPIVFAGGEPEKVALVREKLPDAVYASWRGIAAAVARAIERPPREPVVPVSPLDGYSGRPLPRKLGIKPRAVVGLLAAPRGFRETLGELPEGARVASGIRGRRDTILWFVRSRRILERGVATLAGRDDFRGMWVLWPKKASGVRADLGQQDVRRLGLAAGLVDYKICSVDAVWSGLLFARRAVPGARGRSRRRGRAVTPGKGSGRRESER
jgi:hypothetical protein